MHEEKQKGEAGTDGHGEKAPRVLVSPTPVSCRGQLPSVTAKRHSVTILQVTLPSVLQIDPSFPS
jgi:hypothetical protein